MLLVPKGGSCHRENSGTSSAAVVGLSGGGGGEVGICSPEVLRGRWRDTWVRGSQVGKDFAGDNGDFNVDAYV